MARGAAPVAELADVEVAAADVCVCEKVGMVVTEKSWVYNANRSLVSRAMKWCVGGGWGCVCRWREPLTSACRALQASVRCGPGLCEVW